MPTSLSKACHHFTNHQEGWNGCWRCQELSSNLKSGVNVKAHWEDGLPTNHDLSGSKSSSSKIPVRLSCQALHGDGRTESTFGHFLLRRIRAAILVCLASSICRLRSTRSTMKFSSCGWSHHLESPVQRWHGCVCSYLVGLNKSSSMVASHYRCHSYESEEELHMDLDTTPSKSIENLNMYLDAISMNSVKTQILCT